MHGLDHMGGYNIYSIWAMVSSDMIIEIIPKTWAIVVWQKMVYTVRVLIIKLVCAGDYSLVIQACITA